jgi:hypothetical protein
VLADHLRQPRLVDRQLAGGERGDLRLVDVHRPDLVALGGEAGGGDQPDPADADDADRLALAAGPSRPVVGHGAQACFIEVAIASISASGMLCERVLLSQ